MGTQQAMLIIVFLETQKLFPANYMNVLINNNNNNKNTHKSIYMYIKEIVKRGEVMDEIDRREIGRIGG